MKMKVNKIEKNIMNKNSYLFLVKDSLDNEYWITHKSVLYIGKKKTTNLFNYVRGKSDPEWDYEYYVVIAGANANIELNLSEDAYTKLLLWYGLIDTNEYED